MQQDDEASPVSTRQMVVLAIVAEIALALWRVRQWTQRVCRR